MGLVIDFIVLENKTIDAFKEDRTVIDSYLEREDVELYGSDSKSWSPMFELLFILDSSENKVLREVENQANYIEESPLNDWGYVLYSNVVSQIWKVLQSITEDVFVKHMADPELIERIMAIPGYYNQRIVNKIGVLESYKEFYKAVKSAYIQKKGLFITFG